MLTLFDNARFEPQTRFEFGEGIEVRLPVAAADDRKALLRFEGRGKANGRKITFGDVSALEKAQAYARQFNARQEKLNGDYRIVVEVGRYAEREPSLTVRPAAKAEAVEAPAPVAPAVATTPAVTVKAPAGIGYATSDMAKVPNAEAVRDTVASVLLAVGNGDARKQVWFPKSQVGVTTDPARGVAFYVKRSFLNRESLGWIVR